MVQTGFLLLNCVTHGVKEPTEVSGEMWRSGEDRVLDGGDPAFSKSRALRPRRLGP
jgi:hypothetical protein